ncbi:MAG: glycosyltransferase [Gemmobacter sp.]
MTDSPASDGHEGPLAFDAAWYLAQNPDVAAEGRDPADHYRAHGRGEGRWPRPLLALAHDCELWSGFEDLALPALHALAAAPVEDPDAALAAWLLARWHASRDELTAARHWIHRFMKAADGPAMVRHPGPWLLAIDILCRCNDPVEAAAVMDWLRPRFPGHPDLAIAAGQIAAGPAAATAVLGALWARRGLATVTLDPGRLPALDRLRAEAPAAAMPDAPVVSVLMPARNAATTIDTALGSLLGQSWRPLEVLIIDDASTDATPDRARTWAARDSRVRVLGLPAPSGAYVARNRGLAEATGAFVTVMDADDWAHPQKIEAQVRLLLDRPYLPACVSHWLRVTPDLRPWRLRMEDGWIHRNVSSLMVRRAVHEQLGFWDRVRADADTEFWARIRHVHGPDSVAEVHPGLPLSLGRVSVGSITRSETLHARTQFGGLRQDYQRAARRWHERAKAPEALHLPEVPAARPFDIPDAIGVGDPPAALQPDDILRRSALFDARWYRARWDDIRQSDTDPALHYLQQGAAEDRDPGPGFSTSGYRIAAGIGDENPLLHWERAGRSAGLSPCPTFRGALYDRPGPTVLVVGHQAGRELFGAERSLIGMVQTEGEGGHRPVVLLPQLRDRGYLDRLLPHAAEVRVIPYGWKRFDRPADPATVERVRLLIRETGAAVLHQNTLVLEAPLLAARAESVPATVHVRELPETDPDLCRALRADPGTIRDWLLASADRFTVYGPEVARWLDVPGRTVPGRIRIDSALFDLPARDDGAPVVGMISANTAKKGVADFVAMARHLAPLVPDLRCLLIGPDSSDLEALGALPGNVLRSPYAAEPADAMARVDVLVSLSRFNESFGRTVLEALAAGRPVVTYRRGTPPLIVEHGISGLVVPADDPAAAAVAVARIVTEAGLLDRMRTAARLRARMIDRDGLPEPPDDPTAAAPSGG